ncbi:MerR family transcriptional regulator [Rhodococcus sp. NPDC059968]|uniref:MerR family transcriptional regulator n=1 Tax=Rhodococcus sp. NPDC059968 TaxID=3347017 RepID=UPI003671E8F7
MRVSELVARTGVPLATVKYYLREGLLMPGEATSATQARYGEKHVERLGLVKALAGAGLPIPRIREILRLVDHPDGSLFEVLGEAIAQLPPYLDASDTDGGGDANEFPRARAVLDRLGQVYDPGYVAVGQLERALEGLEEAGIPMTEERLEAYGRHVRGIAEIDIGLMPTESAEDAIRYAVLGTAIYEPVIAAMRRLAHQDVAQKRLRKPEEQDQQ